MSKRVAGITPFLLLLALVVPVRAEEDGEEERYRTELARAQSLLASGRARDSIDVFEEANKLAGKKSVECFLGLSLAHLRIGELDDARKHAEKAVETARTSHEQAEGRYYLGSAFMGLDKGDGKKITEGIPELRKAVEIEPENGTYRYQLGLALLRVSEEDAGVEQLERFLELVPDSPRAEEVRGIIEYPPRAHPDYAPEFEVVTASGRELSLVNQRGRVLVVDFWATWCPPCVESVPWLKSLHEELSDEPFTLLSVSLDQDEAAWSTFVQEKEMTWEQYHAQGKGIVTDFLPERFAIPTYFVIDGSGVIRGVFQGDGRKSLWKLKSTVEDCLEELPSR